MNFKYEIAPREGVSGRTAVVRFVARVEAQPRTGPPTITVAFVDEKREGESHEDEEIRWRAAAEALIEQLYLQINH